MEMIEGQTLPEAQATRAALGERMYALIARLYPLCRSITGPGLRQTLAILSEVHPIHVTEVPSGTALFDWTVPREWVIRDAYIKDSSGRRIVDFQKHNLHVLNYSAPIRAKVSLAELEPHLYSLPEQPDAIPYRTSYHSEQWGFCLPHRQREALDPTETYEVCVDSELKAGSMSVGEIILPGTSDEEIIISTHTCHPSMCNDNLSGLVVVAHMAAAIAKRPRRKTYRFLFGPGTLGSLAWLSANESRISKVKSGLVINGVGDRGEFTYKRSRRGDALVDQAAVHVLAMRGRPHKVIDFYPFGYEERQFCSPGFNLGIGRLSRTLHGTYPEYHTSSDNLDFVSPGALQEAYETALSILDVVENDRFYRSLNPKGEPQLGKRGLYRQVAGQAQTGSDEMALLWMMAYADGEHSVLEIAEKASIPFARMSLAADRLEHAGLLQRIEYRLSRDPSDAGSI